MVKTAEGRYIKDEVLAMAASHGFVRVRILAPFEPGDFLPSPPENHRAGSPSLLTAALPYGNQGPSPVPFPAPSPPAAPSPEAPGGEERGCIAPFARRNYYREAVKRMKALAVEFRSRFGGKRADFRILCNSPIPEKPLAEACGLGFLGRNGLIITPEAGSLVIIAAMTLPFFLEGDGPPEVQAKSGAGAGGRAFPLCAGCDQDAPPCAGACPTGAVRGDGTIALERCIQWYASGKGETVPANIAALWGERLYGCVECQNACVHNRRPIKGVETGEGPLPEYFNVKELLTLSEDELKKMFKGTAMGLSWLGPAAIRRNAEMVLRGIKG